ncbi:MAG: hypothetical protein RJB09_2331, partial [Pseudomonadota bacterium]
MKNPKYLLAIIIFAFIFPVNHESFAQDYFSGKTITIV